MNIFVLDRLPECAAQAHADTHVVKMPIETAQLLSTAWHVLHNAWHLAEDDKEALSGLRSVATPAGNPRQPPLPIDADGPLRAGDLPARIWLLGGQRIYAKTHEHHPCATWVRASRANYIWAWRLGMALCAEYTYRYAKEHATLRVLRTLELAPPACAGGNLTPFEPCMPAAYQDRDVVAAYRNCYRHEKAELLKYTKRAPPDWL
jgi:hypothetical protein